MVEQSEQGWKDTLTCFFLQKNLACVGYDTERHRPKVKDALISFCCRKCVELINLFQKEVQWIVPFCFREGSVVGEILHPNVLGR